MFNFQSQFVTQYNLPFANILLVTIPPLIMFIFFNWKIVEGMGGRLGQGLMTRGRAVRTWLGYG
jgi:raffinose/stachyose/melibiose transport system permease protein